MSVSACPVVTKRQGHSHTIPRYVYRDANDAIACVLEDVSYGSPEEIRAAFRKYGLDERGEAACPPVAHPLFPNLQVDYQTKLTQVFINAVLNYAFPNHILQPQIPDLALIAA